MDLLLSVIDTESLTGWEAWLEEIVFLATSALLLVEIARYIWRKQMTGRLIGDIAVNYLTLAVFIGVNLLFIGTVYLFTYFTLADLALFEIETTWLSLIVCVVLADLAYYAEHRFSHRVGFAWASHSVHHSSPHFNISVANRFGLLDALLPIPFHLPLILIGFDPYLVLFAEALVLIWQTPLHTETVRRLPRWIEAVFNTPSHHRVHHGANEAYLDKNYGGVLIVWDRLFGTFAREEQPVRYGLVEPLGSINPLKIMFHGFARLGKRMRQTSDVGEAMRWLIAPPDWQPAERQRKS